MIAAWYIMLSMYYVSNQLKKLFANVKENMVLRFQSDLPVVFDAFHLVLKH